MVRVSQPNEGERADRAELRAEFRVLAMRLGTDEAWRELQALCRAFEEVLKAADGGTHG